MRNVRFFAAWLDGEAVSKEAVARWKAYLQEKGFAPCTVNSKLSALNSFFAYAGLEGYQVKFLHIQRKVFRDNSRDLSRGGIREAGRGGQTTGEGAAGDGYRDHRGYGHAVYALQPGDSVMLSLALVNGDSQGTDWYMTNEVLSSLEDSQSIGRGSGYGGREQDFCRICSPGDSFCRSAYLLCHLAEKTSSIKNLQRK